jgi:hypothetical protein
MRIPPPPIWLLYVVATVVLIVAMVEMGAHP